MITEKKKDALHNALLVGMDKADAYIYAGLTPAEIEEVTTDEGMQNFMNKVNKSVEYSLLDQMRRIADKQERMGKESATAWMLEKLYPRYAGKPKSDNGEVHIHLDPTDPAKYDTVEINNGNKSSV